MCANEHLMWKAGEKKAKTNRFAKILLHRAGFSCFVFSMIFFTKEMNARGEVA